MKQGSFAFRYAEPLPYMLLDTIGWQTADTPQYRNDGQARTDRGHIIFQYTLSGEGRIELGGRTYGLPAGTAFAVRIPGDHRYYYDAQSKEPWEFIWLNAKGEDAVRLWDRIVEREGHLLRFGANAVPMARFWDMYRAVSEERLSDPAELSAMLYRFMLSLLTPDAASAAPRLAKNSIVNRAKRYMAENYALPLTLEEIAAHGGVSREYLCRLFRKNDLASPLEFLRRRRVEAAVTMLRATDLSAQDIGKRCGFDSPSYFSKIFRQYLGLSPGEYRAQRLDYPFDTIFLE